MLNWQSGQSKGGRLEGQWQSFGKKNYHPTDRIIHSPLSYNK